MTRGLFITFEGGEASGKTTQIARLHNWLESAGHDVVRTREPGGTPGAESIRDILMSGNFDKWSAETELLLMYAARRDHTEKVIWPALASGKIVLCDRYADSSMAYQGYARGLGRKAVKRVHKAVLNGFYPDLTFIFDIPVEVAQKRLSARAEENTRFDAADLNFHQTVREAFLKIAGSHAKRYQVVNAAMSMDALTQTLQGHIHGLLEAS